MVWLRANLSNALGVISIGFYVLQFGQIYKSISLSHLLLSWIFIRNVNGIVNSVYKGPYGLFAILVVAAIVPGVLHSPFVDDPIASLTIVVQFLFLFLLVVPCFIFVASKNIYWSANCMIFFGALASIVAISLFVFELGGYNMSGSSYLTIALGKDGVEGFGGRYGIGNPNMHAIMIVLPIIFLYSSNCKIASMHILAITIIMISLLLTFSRGGYLMVILTFVLGWIVGLIVRRDNFLKWRGGGYIYVIFIVVLCLYTFDGGYEELDKYMSLARIVDAADTFKDESGPGGRMTLLIAGLNGIAQNPLVGIGFGQALSLIGEEIPHVLIVLWTLENGIISSLLLIAATLIYFRTALFAARRMNNYYLLSGVAAFIIWTFTFTYTYYPGFAIIYGLPFIFLSKNGSKKINNNVRC